MTKTSINTRKHNDDVNAVTKTTLQLIIMIKMLLQWYSCWNDGVHIWSSFFHQESNSRQTCIYWPIFQYNLGKLESERLKVICNGFSQN